MRFTLSWLKEYIDINYTAREIEQKLTDLGIEVESLTSPPEGFIVGKILEFHKHPDADKLNICQVDIGNQVVEVVCGASNVRLDMYVVFAPPGVIIPSTGKELKVGKIRGVQSNGMLCSYEELNYEGSSEGIIDISTECKPGDAVNQVLDAIFDISITPNRGDCFSVYGIARELAAGFNIPLKKLYHEENPKNFYAISIQNISNMQSPGFIQERLKLQGINPKNLIVDVTNYIAFDLGQPMHAYDSSKVQGVLQVRNAYEGEVLIGLNDQTIPLCAEDIVIADEQSPLALAGVMGGKDSGVNDETKDILLEAAIFDPVQIALSGQRHKITTPSRMRFERGIDPHMVLPALKRAIHLIGEYGSGTVQTELEKGAPIVSKTITFPFNLVEKIGGIKIPEQDIIDYLNRLGFHVAGETVTVPSWRHDINIPEDLVEEVLRLHGYQHLVLAPLLPKNAKPEQKDITPAGLMEVLTFSFTSAEKAALFGNDDIVIDNPAAITFSTMRPSLLTGLMDAALYNFNNGYDRGGFYEKARVYRKDCEELCLSGLRYGMFMERNWHTPERVVDCFDAKNDGLSVLPEGLIDRLQVRTDNLPAYYHPGQSGAWCLGKTVVGYFGSLHPKVLKFYDFKKPCVAFEIFLDRLPKMSQKAKTYVPSMFPRVQRDLGFIVDRDFEAGQLIRTVRSVQDIEDVSIFDVYIGEKMESGKKALSIQFYIVQKEKTLTDTEINEIMIKIAENVQKQGGELRGKL